MNSKIIRLRRMIFGLVGFLLRHLAVIILGILITLLVFAGNKARNYLAQAGLGSIDLFTFSKNPQEIIDNTNDRTNFLILGIRGEGSDSPDLTDTILIASYSYTKRNFTLISIPRDLWVTSLKTKINSVYHYGQFKDANGGGIKLVQSAILETLGLPIHYTAVVNFSLFKDAIDIVGGVDVDVTNTFTDNQFPIEGKENVFPITERYETITFNAGLNHMDGITALKFVRSRHAKGDEGTDIARDHRQQLVTTALKQKVLDTKFILNRDKTITLYKLLKSNLDTNVNEKLYPSLARIAFDSFHNQTQKLVLSYLPDENGVSILENPPVSRTYLNQWVLIAKDGNWSALQQYIQNKL